MKYKHGLKITIYLTCIFICTSFLFSCSDTDKNKISFDPAENSHIVFIGNTFAERLQNYNYFEVLLHKSFPDRNLTVRNLGWSADEINLRPRPLNFGSQDDHLSMQKADIIFAFYGLNEAFKGVDSLATFEKQLEDYLVHLGNQTYNNKSNPEIILVSPIEHEKLGGHFADPSEHNANMKLYTKAMQKVAKSLNIPFIDLFNTTNKWAKNMGEKRSINGIHLNADGYKKVSEWLASVLQLPVSEWQDNAEFNALKKVIDEKNQQFFYKYRAINGEYINGSRKEPWVQPPGGPISFPSEFEKLDQMVVQLDSVVWSESSNPSQQNLARIQQIVNDTTQYEAFSKDNAMKITSVDQFKLPEGYEINLFASEHDFPIGNPVKITFDPQGRMWVASMPSYPHYLPGAPPNDKILILEDTDNDGKADKHTVFADSLYLPLGFELGNGGAYVTQVPNLVFLKDTDGDGKADLREILLHGFGTEDPHHSISAHSWGPDGALYMHEGTFLHSQVETPYGPRRGAYGTTWRYEPLTMKLDSYISYPYANPWGNVFTKDGTHLISDVSTGMNYFVPPLTVASEYPKKHVEMKDFLTINIRPKTCGLEVISSSNFPTDVQGDVLFNTFIGFQGVKQHSITAEGSGVVGKEVEALLQSNDPNFRPVDVQFGPDGALYIVDWYNPVINHGEVALRDPRRDHVHGRIWRITYKGKPLVKPIDFTKLSIAQTLDELKSYEDRTRYRARVQLSQYTGEQVLPELQKWLASLDSKSPDYAQHRLEALWVHQQFNQPNETLLNELLADKDETIRTAAVRVLFYWRELVKGTEDKLIKAAADPSQKVRLQAISGLSFFPTEKSILALLKASDMPMDDYIGYALNESFKELKPVWFAMFKQDKNFLKNEPQKAKRLLESLADPARLDIPPFVKSNPEWPKYMREALSESDYQELGESEAVKKFLLEKELAAKQEVANSNAEAGRKIINMSAVPGKMIFDVTTFEVVKGEAISLIFDNTDAMLHNLVIIQPGSSAKVGTAADKMAADKDGYEKSFVPAIPEVLFYTPLVSGGEKFVLRFDAPAKTGEYPFLCTFPGHWQTMKGVMKVVDK